jgi:TonB-linked SusC/RagA family outer membrane protein
MAGCFASAQLSTDAQDVATTERTVALPSSAYRKSQHPLKDVLTRLEKQFSVHFMYEGTLLDNQLVTYKANQKDNLENILRRILTNGLGYQRIDNSLYAIFSSPGAPKTAPLPLPAKQTPLNSSSTATAEISLTGLVTDPETKQGLPGVSIVLKGTTTGTTTDSDGRYRIVVPNQNATIIFSYVGYVAQEVVVGNQTTINVSMQLDSKAIDEVVVVGYGTQKKSDIISSVVTIKPEKMTKMVTLDAGEMLRGKAAGVLVTTSDAGPGGSSNIQIRGKNSINGGSSPIVIADGIPVGSINDINPADIASVEVLKDAAAQAIYGARASNGVILITTKRGKAGALVINYDSYYGVQNAKRNFDIYNGAEFAQLKREADRAVNKGVLRADNLIFSAAELQAIAEGRSIDWPNEVFKNASIQNHNLNFSAGNEKTKIYVGLNYQNMKGIVPNTEIQKGTLRMNIDQNLTKWLKIGANTSFQISRSSDPDVGANVRLAITASPLGNIYNPDGSYNVRPGGNQESFNPLLDLTESTRRKNERNDILNLFVDISPIKGFNYRINASRRSWNYKELNYSTQKSSSGYANGTGSGGITYRENAQWQIENILTYNMAFQKSNINLTAVGSLNENNAYDFTNSTSIVPNDILGIYGLESALKNTPSIGGSQRRLVSGVGRIQYDYDAKYYATLSARADGSSVFGANNKWGYFPAVALGWNVYRERFFDNLTFVNNLKLRASYGSVGNEGINPYGSLSLANQLDYLFGVEKISGFAPGTALANPNLRWETSTTLNTALDFAFFNNRVSGTIEAYKTRTTDLLVNRQLNAAIGYSSIRDNIGEVQNKGIELQLDVVSVKTGNLTVKNGVLFSMNRNKIIRLYGDLNNDGIQDDDVANRWFIGQPIEVFYQPKFVGIYQLGDATDGKIDPNTRKLAVPGDVKLDDVNGDGKIDIEDNQITSKYQNWIGSFNTTINFRRVDFSMDIYTVQGITRNNVFLYDYTYGGDLRGNRNGIKVDYWTPENPSNTYPRPNAGNSPVGMPNLGLQDASYWRLQNISLGYSLPESLLAKLKINRLRLYCTGQNLLTVTKFQSFSPEQDAAAYPTVRSVIVGLQLGF